MGDNWGAIKLKIKLWIKKKIGSSEAPVFLDSRSALHVPQGGFRSSLRSRSTPPAPQFRLHSSPKVCEGWRWIIIKWGGEEIKIGLGFLNKCKFILSRLYSLYYLPCKQSLRRDGIVLTLVKFSKTYSTIFGYATWALWVTGPFGPSTGAVGLPGAPLLSIGSKELISL